MLPQDLLHTLALLKTEGIGDVIAKKLLTHLGSAEEIFKAKPIQLAKIDGIGHSIIKNLKKKEVFLAAEAELKFIQSQNLNTLFYQET